MNRNSGLPTYGDITFWTLNIAISTITRVRSITDYVRDIFTKLHTNLKHHKTTYETHKP